MWKCKRKSGIRNTIPIHFYQVRVHLGSCEEGCEPPLNCLWSCSGSCASVEGRLLKALVHSCITTSFSHHRLYHPLLFDVFFWVVCVCLSVTHTSHRVRRVSRPRAWEVIVCMWQVLKWLRPVKGSSSATDHNTSGQWSQPVKWIDVQQQNKWVSDSFPLSDESRLNAERLFTEREGGGEVGLACWMLKVSPGAHALFQLLLVCKTHAPARAEYRIVSTFRGSISAVYTAQPKQTLCSLSSSTSPSKRRGENVEGELTWCSCSHAFRLVPFNSLQKMINKTAIKILWREHREHDEQICTLQCYITDLSPLSLFLHHVSLSVSWTWSFLFCKWLTWKQGTE